MRCMTTTSSQVPNLRPTSRSVPTTVNPTASCSRIDASWPPAMRATMVWNPRAVASSTISAISRPPTPRPRTASST